jgi:hypothetical protein
MFPGDVVMDHTLPFHGSVYYPSLEGRLRGAGFGAWQKPCTTSAPTIAYLARGVVVTAQFHLVCLVKTWFAPSLINE